jgi:hypothetical protein
VGSQEQTIIVDGKKNIYSLDFSFNFTTHGFGAYFFALTIALLSAC